MGPSLKMATLLFSALFLIFSLNGCFFAYLGLQGVKVASKIHKTIKDTDAKDEQARDLLTSDKAARNQGRGAAVTTCRQRVPPSGPDAAPKEGLVGNPEDQENK